MAGIIFSFLGQIKEPEISVLFFSFLKGTGLGPDRVRSHCLVLPPKKGGKKERKTGARPENQSELGNNTEKIGANE